MRLLNEAVYSRQRVDPQDSEATGFLYRHRHTADRDTSSACGVMGDQLPVIHFVNMISRQYQRVAGTLRLHEIEVLIHRVGRPGVPGLVNALLRRPGVDELTERAREEIPSGGEMSDE